MLTTNFSGKEMSCPCCGAVDMNDSFMRLLQLVRLEFGQPMTVNSGYRCVRHNHGVGGSSTSSHLTGLAADIGVANSSDRFKLVEAAQKVGIKRIGVAKSFIHLDADPGKPDEVLCVY